LCFRPMIIPLEVIAKLANPLESEWSAIQAPADAGGWAWMRPSSPTRKGQEGKPG
jgi:hypothetical protein